MRDWAKLNSMGLSSRQLLKKAYNQTNIVRQYLILQRAMQVAQRRGDTSDAVRVLTDLLGKFQIPRLAAHVALVEQLGKTTRRRVQCAALVKLALETSSQARAARQMQIVRRCDRIALQAAAWAGSQQLVRKAALAVSADDAAKSIPQVGASGNRAILVSPPH